MIRDKGFTLLELLLAIAIFSLVAAIGYGAYSTTVGNLARIDNNGEAMERSAAIFARLAEELASLVFDSSSEFVGETAEYPGGRGDSLIFLGNSPLLLDRQQRRPGQVLIGYQSERDQQSGLLTLYRTESEVLPGVAPGQGPMRRDLLARDLKELRFSYHRQDGTVVSTWQGRGGDGEARATRKLPWAVTAQLVFPPSGPDGQDRRFTMFARLPEGGEL